MLVYTNYAKSYEAQSTKAYSQRPWCKMAEHFWNQQFIWRKRKETCGIELERRKKFKSSDYRKHHPFQFSGFNTWIFVKFILKSQGVAVCGLMKPVSKCSNCYLSLQSQVCGPRQRIWIAQITILQYLASWLAPDTVWLLKRRATSQS